MQALLELLERELGEPVAADTPLVSAGLVDSLRFAEIVAALERHFGVSIDPLDVGVDNFDTPAQMLEHVRSLA
ncbi:MAG: acyl carrier protein [Candidatus Eisenbacteria bacterium]